MRMSKRFGQTLREAPGAVEVISHQLLVRAGFIRQLAAGIFSYLPMAYISMEKIKDIMRLEMNKISGQEIQMPVVHPADIWQQTNRWYEIGSEMGRFYDKNERDMVLAMTHEEVVASLARQDIQSYKQLPNMIYHIQTKWRDDPRPRAGLIRVREFHMLDSYSLDATWESLDQQYRDHYQAYFNIYNRCALPVIAVASDTGMMGGTMAHEYMYLTDIGEDTLLIQEESGYKANKQVAEFIKPAAAAEELKEMEKVATPNCKTIEELANFLGVPKSKTAKAVFMMATVPGDSDSGYVEKFVFAIVRGDMELSETKLTNAIKAKEVRPALETEIMATGAVPGYASPVGLRLKNCIVVVDDILPTSANLVAGANDAGYHYINVNLERDYQADLITDIASANEGDLDPVGGRPMKTYRGVEVGNIFKLGTLYTEALGANFLDQNGKLQPVIMGSYGIGVGRLLACVAEHYNDEYGLIWPITVSPYEVHLVALRGGFEEADKFYEALKAEGIEVLYDDRDESPGVKFNDADLIGVPVRITIGGRSLKNGGVEMKLRRDKERSMVALADALETVKATVAQLYAEIEAGIVEVPFEA